MAAAGTLPQATRKYLFRWLGHRLAAPWRAWRDDRPAGTHLARRFDQNDDLLPVGGHAWCKFDEAFWRGFLSRALYRGATIAR
jgi:hypothetical protein